MERIWSCGNLLSALKRVEKNKGSYGVDGMSVQKLRAHILEHWESMKIELLEGTYEPQAVCRIEIPKPNNNIHLLSIPTVTDGLIQQAITQVLTSMYGPTFSNHSYDFRPNRSTHDTIRRAKTYLKEENRWGVDIDLKKFFDKINHDQFMGRLAK